MSRLQLPPGDEAPTPEVAAVLVEHELVTAELRLAQNTVRLLQDSYPPPRPLRARVDVEVALYRVLLWSEELDLVQRRARELGLHL